MVGWERCIRDRGMSVGVWVAVGGGKVWEESGVAVGGVGMGERQAVRKRERIKGKHIKT